MAVDKLVDSAQLDSDLTSIANAIRNKGGTNAQLSFPSEFVSAIEAISTSSVKYKSGTYTPVSDISANTTITNTTTIGFTPKIFIFEVNDRTTVNAKGNALLFATFVHWHNGYKATVRYTSGTTVGGTQNANSSTSSDGMFIYRNSSNIIYRGNASYKLYSGVQYNWYAFA